MVRIKLLTTTIIAVIALIYSAGVGDWLSLSTSQINNIVYSKSDAPPGAGPHPVEVAEEGVDFRVVRHAGGTTRVPSNPTRICALACADELLALGIKPVAHSIADGNFPDYLEKPFADVPWIPNVYGGNLPNMEAIIAIRPDLIITRVTSRQTYQQLSKIAPTVVLLDHLVYYRQRVLDVGTIIGRRKDAETRVQWFNAKVAAARGILDKQLGNRSMAILRVRPMSYRLQGDQNHDSPLLYGDLAIRRPRLVTERNWTATMSPEALLHLDADFMIISCDPVAGSRRTLDDLFGHPIWKQVPAARNNHVLLISKYRHWADSGILGRARGIDDVLQAVAPNSIDYVNAAADALLPPNLRLPKDGV
jgi:iron complex transport system substrate-binding protein